MNFKDNLKRLRKENNLSQEDLAEKLNVSRQSVSKWESGAAYPEMDKVLQLCSIFDLNIDELLNQNVKDVKNNKQSKININKYIDDFLSYITKTINLFTSMKFKQKVKCIFEQFVLIFIFAVLALLIGSIFSSLIRNIISFLPDRFFYGLCNLFESIYFLAAFILGVALISHIFKVRYLDYYIINNDEELPNNKEVIVADKKEERIIIRDPKHSEYRFISGLFKFILFIIKLFVIFIGLLFCLSLIFFAFLLGLSFLFVKTGFVFIGILLILLSVISINIVILYIVYNFVVNKKCKLKMIFTILLTSLLLIGAGSALSLIGIKDFKYIDNYDDNYLVSEEDIIKMEDDLYIPYSDEIEYIEDNNKDLKVIYKHTKYCNVETHKYDSSIMFYLNCFNNISEIDNLIKDINSKRIVDPDNYYKVYIYTSKKNIDKLKANEKKIDSLHRDEYINDLKERIDILNEENSNLRNLLEEKE